MRVSRLLVVGIIAIFGVRFGVAQNQSDSSGTTLDPNIQKTSDEVYKYMIEQKDALRAIDASKSEEAKEKFDKMKSNRRFDRFIRRSGGLFAMDSRSGPSLRVRMDEWETCMANLQSLEMQMGKLGVESLPRSGKLFVRSFNSSLSLMRELTEEVAHYIDVTETLVSEAEGKPDVLKLVENSLVVVEDLMTELEEIRALQVDFAKAKKLGAKS